jgi:hypothetical protein
MQMKQLIEYLVEDTTTLHEGKLNRLRLNFIDLFNMSYDPTISKELIDDYIDDYELDGLKEYMFVLRAIIDDDSSNGILRAIWKFFSKDVRKNYVTYKTEIKKQFDYAEAAISRMEKRPFNFEQWYAKTLEQSTLRAVKTSANVSTLANIVNIVSSVSGR